MSDPERSRKSDLRAQMRARLRAMTDADRHDASAAACGRLTALEPFLNAGVVMLYMPLPLEVDLTPAAITCFRMGKVVCVPRVDWKRRDMAPIEVASFDDHSMDLDEHGIRTPRGGAPVPPTLIDVVVVPGLAFDDRGYRLGRGGGFYDRLLAKLRKSATTVGLAFECQIVDAVPIDDRDMAVDMIVTERRATRSDGSRTRQ